MNTNHVPTIAHLACDYDPLDIIMTGQSIAQSDADIFGDRGTSDWVVEPCDFVDCDRSVLIPVDEYDNAVDLIIYRDVDDDSLLTCCQYHEINNWPRIDGPADIREARTAVRNDVISDFTSDDRTVS